MMLSDGLGLGVGRADDGSWATAELPEVGGALGCRAGELMTCDRTGGSGGTADDAGKDAGGCEGVEGVVLDDVSDEGIGGRTTAELDTTAVLIAVDRLGTEELGRCDGVALGDGAGVLDTGSLGGGVETGTLVDMVGDGRGGVDGPGRPVPAQLSRMLSEVTTAPSRPITRT